MNERDTLEFLPLDQVTPGLRDRWPGQTLGEIIALIRSWHAPVLPTPAPSEFRIAMDEEAQHDSRALSVIVISAML